MRFTRVFAALAIVPALAAATPAFAQTAPTAGSNCRFQDGFSTMSGLIPDVVGSCSSNEMYDANGDAVQETTNGLLSWNKATNVLEFTNGEKTWVDSGYGLILRNGNTSYSWEGPVSLVAGVAINHNGQIIDPITGKVLPVDSRFVY